MYISDKELNRQANIIFEENKISLAESGGQFFSILTYMSAASDAIQKAPAPVTMFGNFFLTVFVVVAIVGITIPCLSGLYRITLWEFANILTAGIILFMIYTVKAKIGLVSYVSEKCNSPWCNPDESPMLKPKEPYADFYDESQRLYMKYLRDAKGNVIGAETPDVTQDGDNDKDDEADALF